MWLDAIFFIALCVILAIQALFTLIPLGNEKSTVRRLPWVTFSIMAICVIVYYVSLPSTVQQERELMKARTEMEKLIVENPSILADEDVRRKLEENGVISKEEVEAVERELDNNIETEAQYKTWLKGTEAEELRKRFDEKLVAFKTATEENLWYKYGLAPNGKWKAHQLLTAMFLHGSTLHLFGNLIFFFAVGFSLEDLWGRSTFLAFYLLAGVAACMPELINPGPLPMIGASGAISGTMGAFLIRLHSTKVKIGWMTMPLAIPFLVFGRKPYGTINVAAYIFLPFYFISQVLPWWFFSKVGLVSGVAYSAHVSGFLFGALFALFMKISKAEERYINPKIEAKVSFAAPTAVTDALEMLDRGEILMSERKLKSHLITYPNDVDAILALIQVYQRTLNYEQLNNLYGRLIHHHLIKQDKEAALYAYDNLLSSFPDNQIDVRIPLRDWLAVCEYLREVEMNREAAVEYERLAAAYPDDPLTLRACVQGGEAALIANDNPRALRLFEKAESMSPPSPLVMRIEAGIEKCRRRINQRPDWTKKAPKPKDAPTDIEQQKINW